MRTIMMKRYMFKRFTPWCLTAFVAALGVSSVAPIARAELGIVPGSFSVTASSNQAGAHPDLTTSFAFTTDSSNVLTGHPRDTVVDLPAGFAGTLPAVPSCLPEDFSTLPGGFHAQTCPLDSQVGTASLVVNVGYQLYHLVVPVYNLTPNQGETAKLGFSALVFKIQAVVSVRPGDYGIRTEVKNADAALGDVDSVALTLWGVPANATHDSQRGLLCTEVGDCEYCDQTGCGEGRGPSSSGVQDLPFLRNPTECTSVPLTATLSVRSWEDPEALHTASADVGPITGCEHLGFEPTISVQPLLSQASSPSGYTVDLKVPQNDNPEGVASADVRKAVVTLPQGVVLSPSAANGLSDCTDAEVGLGNDDPVACPPASKVGEATLTTPALQDKLTGGVYLAGPSSGPITEPPYRIFLTLAGDGVNIKLAGSVQPDPVTGQLRTTFEENPDLPFSELVIKITNGPRAPLVNPSTCGAFTTSTDFTPWSSPFTPDATPFSVFGITGCAGPRFAPAFAAGTVSNQAGGFSPFTLTMSRSDADQDMSGIEVHMPPGLLGMLSSVVLCPEPQASQGACGSQSLIGHTITAAGAGPDPYWIGGNVFLTGPYKGAPFGLAVVVHALAGPFDLGNVIVRAAVNVDSHTGAVTVTSDPLPTILRGVPLALKTVNVIIDRPGFIFNPTDCNPLAVSGALTSTQGMYDAVSSRFQVANCTGLPFKPSFTASTQAQTSKAGGASLRVKVTSGSGQANIGKVRIVLPKQLPARLTTLQKACPDTVFDVNPSSCPAASTIGTAIARTPVLTSPLVGPVYLVSHGGVAFPDAVIVLQGEGVTLYLDGNTNIKKGITSSTFNSVPDAPITSFETTLPEGPHSAFAADIPAKAKGNLCKQTLTMPTVLTGQNGAVVTQTTKIAVTGCPKSKAKKGKKASSVHHGKGEDHEEEVGASSTGSGVAFLFGGAREHRRRLYLRSPAGHGEHASGRREANPQRSRGAREPFGIADDIVAAFRDPESGCKRRGGDTTGLFRADEWRQREVGCAG